MKRILLLLVVSVLSCLGYAVSASVSDTLTNKTGYGFETADWWFYGGSTFGNVSCVGTTATKALEGDTSLIFSVADYTAFTDRVWVRVANNNGDVPHANSALDVKGNIKYEIGVWVYIPTGAAYPSTLQTDLRDKKGNDIYVKRFNLNLGGVSTRDAWTYVSTEFDYFGDDFTGFIWMDFKQFPTSGSGTIYLDNFTLVKKQDISTPVVQPYTITPSDVTFNTSTGTVSRYTNTSKTNIIIPSSFNVGGTDYPIKVIDSYAFSSKNLSAVQFSEGLEYINTEAFKGNSIKSVVLPSTLKEVLAAAFMNNQIKTLEVPQGCTRLMNRCFNQNVIDTINGQKSDGLIFARLATGGFDSTKVVSYGGRSKVIDFIPNTVTSFDNFAFYFCQLQKVVLPNSVTSVAKNAFWDNQISELTLSENITVMEDKAFCKNKLTWVKIPDSLEVMKYSVFAENQIDSIAWGKSLKNIWGGAFKVNQLKSVTLPNTVIEIGNNAFSENDAALTSIALPESVQGFSNTIWYNGQDQVVTSITDLANKYVARGSVPSTADKIYDVKINLAGYDVDVRIYKPDMITLNDTAPLVLCIHGAGSNGPAFLTKTRFAEVADTAGFIVVAPTAAYGPAICNALIDWMKENYTIDTDRIYSAGFSVGAVDVLESSMGMDTRLAAIGTMSFGDDIDTMAIRNHEFAHPMPLLHMQGTQELFDRDVPPIMNLWREKMNILSTPTVVTMMEDKDPSDGCTVEFTKWEGGDKGVTLEQYKVIGGGHNVVGSGSPACNDYVAADVLWRFFKKYKLSDLMDTQLEIKSNKVEPLSIYPNPTDFYFEILTEINVNSTCSVYALNGELIKTWNGIEGQLDVSDLASGIYMISVIDNNKLYIDKLIIK